MVAAQCREQQRVIVFLNKNSAGEAGVDLNQKVNRAFKAGAVSDGCTGLWGYIQRNIDPIVLTALIQSRNLKIKVFLIGLHTQTNISGIGNQIAL